MNLESLKEDSNTCKDTCMSNLISKVTQGFYMTYQSHLLIKKTLKDPNKQENYWIQILKTKAPLRLTVEDAL